MTPEAWAFFSANSVALVGVLKEQLAAKKKANKGEKLLVKAVSNTNGISNGTMPQLITDVGDIKTLLVGIDQRVTALEKVKR